MTQNRSEDFAPTDGEVFKPAVGKLFGMLIAFVLSVLGGGFAAYAWWTEMVLPGGMVLTGKAGIVGLIWVPLGAFLALVMVGLLATAKRLVIGADCVQLQSRGRVAVHIPYANVAGTYANGDGGAGVVGLKMRDRHDEATLVPSWTKDSYEIQVMTYGKPVDEMHRIVKKRLSEFRTRSGAS
jgi:hypothetical protein